VVLIDDGSRGVALCRAKKQAFQFAIEDAFRQLLLIVVTEERSVKVLVEVNASQMMTPDYSSLLSVRFVYRCILVITRLSHFHSSVMSLLLLCLLLFITRPTWRNMLMVVKQ